MNYNKRMFLRKIFIFTIFMCVLNIIITFRCYGYDSFGKAIYFYSPTCASCSKTELELNDYIKNHKDIKIYRYNIMEEKSYRLFKSYCTIYNVEEDKQVVPALFAGKKAFIGKNSISNIIEDDSLSKLTLQNLLEVRDNLTDTNLKTENLRIGYIIAAGILDGVNPCAMAMLIMFISMLSTMENRRIVLASFIYIMSIFLSYFLFGTIMFNFVRNIHLSIVHIIINYIIIVLCIVLSIFNFYDFIQSKNEKYQFIKLQLPKKIKKANKVIMGYVLNKKNSHFFYLFVFLSGIIISLTEFMCTGQIYLPTIVSIIQFSSYNFKFILYLMLYNFCFVLPLIIISGVVIKTRNVMSTSDTIRRAMPIIKLMNSLLFIGICVYFIAVR